MAAKADRKVRVLFVCTGNICRSPTAEAVLRKLAADAGLAEAIETDSAGLGGWHVGEAPDNRAQRCAAARGYDLAGLRARRLRARDFHNFDLIVAMDSGHLAELRRARPEGARAEVRLLPAAASGADCQVPDPYYGQAADFEAALDLIEQGSAALLHGLRKDYL